MTVHCQPTLWNDKLCSLLSAVWGNPIRADFTTAVLEKTKYSRTTKANQKEQSSAGIVLVAGTNKVSQLEQRILQFARKIKIWIISSESSHYPQLWKYVSLCCLSRKKIPECLKRKCSFLAFFSDVSKYTSKFVLVLLGDMHPFHLGTFLCHGENNKEYQTKFVGCIAFNDQSQQVLSSNVPALVLSSFPLSSELLDHHLHPSVIRVILQSAEPMDGDYWLTDQDVEVWLARTIVKFADAVTLLNDQEHQATASRPATLSRL